MSGKGKRSMKLLSYIKGLKKGKDAHRIEKDAMRDAFLADALEGFETVPGDHIRQIEDLRKRIHRQSSPRVRYGRVWSIAAGLLLLLSVGSYFLLIKKESPEQLFSHQFSPIKEDSLYGPPLIITKDMDESMRPQAAQGKNYQRQQQVLKPIEVPVKPVQKEKEQEKQSIRIRGAKSLQAGEYQTLEKEAEMYIADTAVPLAVDMPERMKVTALAEIISDSSAGNAGKIAPITPGFVTLRGKVTDKHGEPIVGADIHIKGQSSGTISDMNGTFGLQAKEGETLAVRYIGYDPVELPVKSSNDLQIAMNESSQSLDEVVVTGYGTSKRGRTRKEPAKISADAIQHKTPEPVNGMKAFGQYLKENLVYPTDGECNKARGEVILSFHVGTNGRPGQIVVVKGICPSADAEAVRLLKEGPDWTFSTKRGNITIKF